jgi:hypothetical protein
MIPGAAAGTCVCPSGTVPKGNECVPQAGGCPSGTVKKGSRCVEQIVCREPARLNRSGTACVCPANMVAKGNTCVEQERKPRVIAPDVRPGIAIPGRGGPRGGQDGPGGPRGGDQGGLPGRR